MPGWGDVLYQEGRGVLEAVGERFGFAASQNSEISLRWSLLVIKSGLVSGLAQGQSWGGVLAAQSLSSECHPNPAPSDCLKVMTGSAHELLVLSACAWGPNVKQWSGS